MLKYGKAPVIPAVMLGVLASLSAFAADGIDWHQFYEHAREEAQRTGKPIFIAFRCAP